MLSSGITGTMRNYLYVKDLMHLSEHNSTPTLSVYHRMAATQLPLNIAVWKVKLKLHPGIDFTQYVTRGIECGFYIRVKGALHPSPLPQNMDLASDLHQRYLQQLQTCCGVLQHRALSMLHIIMMMCNTHIQMSAQKHF